MGVLLEPREGAQELIAGRRLVAELDAGLAGLQQELLVVIRQGQPGIGTGNRCDLGHHVVHKLRPLIALNHQRHNPHIQNDVH